MSRPLILIVDDEAPILNSLRRMLVFEPWDTHFASDATTALSLVGDHEFAVILSDYHLPDGTGAELMRACQERSTDTTRILFSGHVDVQLISNAVNTGEVYRFIAKPWRDEELLNAIRQGIERWQLIKLNRSLEEQREEQRQHLQRFNNDLERMVQQRTRDLEVRNQALVLSQEILDRLPIAVLGIDPQQQIVFANAAARTLAPHLVPGESQVGDLPSGMTADITYVDTSLPDIGDCRFLQIDIGERGSIITGIGRY